MNSIAVLGCGNIGLSLIEGLLRMKGEQELKLIATRRDVGRIGHLQAKGVKVSDDNVYATRLSQFVIVAVKPHKAEEIFRQIADELNENHVLISVVSEVSCEDISRWVGKDLPVFRAMPNTAASIQESITCISASNATKDQVQTVEYLFSGVGRTVVIEEKLMAAATILGACGIAFVMRFIRAMVQGGIQIGFDARTAALITNQTVKGAADLLITNNNHPEAEIDKVTTPMGCTITGLNEMEHQGFSASLIQGIIKSFDKIEH